MVGNAKYSPLCFKKCPKQHVERKFLENIFEKKTIFEKKIYEIAKIFGRF
jgi:hypothetical protein